MVNVEPGGYLQWSEHNLTSTTVKAVKPGVETSGLEYLADHARNVVKHG
jgi:hypothetical protein